MNRASGIPALGQPWTPAGVCQRLQLQASSIGMNDRSELMILVVALAVSTS
jgi:hypothetical protein